MKGNAKVVEALNKALTLELTAVNQYFIHAKMCLNWGFLKLGRKLYDESLGEMKHADALIDRILFLEGIPNMSRYNPIRVGSDVRAQLENDLKLELDGVRGYNEAVLLCGEQKDGGSRELLEHILKDSEGHVDWLESQLHVIKTVGLAAYLSEQIGEQKA